MSYTAHVGEKTSVIGTFNGRPFDVVTLAIPETA